jgi:hypothetical protein
MRAPGRARSHRRGLAALLAGLAAALVTGVALLAVHHPPRQAVPPAVAIRAALRDVTTRHDLAGSHWSSVQTESLGSVLESVSFFAHGQIVVNVLVQQLPAVGGKPSGAEVVSGVNERHQQVPYGNWLAYQPALLVGLCAVFVLMTAVAPWRRLRNLDVAVAVSLVVSMVLFQHRYIVDSLVVAAAAMAYLGLRCAYSGLGPGAARAESTPLLHAVTPGLDAARRVRWLRVWLVVLALSVFMVGAGSPAAVDVLYAVMEGATKLVHGVLPYGNMSHGGIIHGDTYPILSYALYAPLAVLAPVRDNWDGVELGLVLAAVAAIAGAWALFRLTAGPRTKAGAVRRPEDEEAALRSAFAWLAFPTLLATVSTGTTDIVLGAMLGGALLLWRRPTACTAMLAAAGWFKLAPFALLPVCLAPLRGRRLAAALAAIGAVSAPVIGVLLALGGVHGIGAMLHAMSYQFSRGADQSIWGALRIDGLQPLAQACVLGLIIAAVVRLRQAPELARDRVRMAALAAAILIGLQLAADYWAFLYLVWVAPVLCTSLLADAGAPALGADPVAGVNGQLQAAPALAGASPS